MKMGSINTSFKAMLSEINKNSFTHNINEYNKKQFLEIENFFIFQISCFSLILVEKFLNLHYQKV